MWALIVYASDFKSVFVLFVFILDVELEVFAAVGALDASALEDAFVNVDYFAASGALNLKELVVIIVTAAIAVTVAIAIIIVIDI